MRKGPENKAEALPVEESACDRLARLDRERQALELERRQATRERLDLNREDALPAERAMVPALTEQIDRMEAAIADLSAEIAATEPKAGRELRARHAEQQPLLVQRQRIAIEAQIQALRAFLAAFEPAGEEARAAAAEEHRLISESHRLLPPARPRPSQRGVPNVTGSTDVTNARGTLSDPFGMAGTLVRAVRPGPRQVLIPAALRERWARGWRPDVPEDLPAEALEGATVPVGFRGTPDNPSIGGGVSLVNRARQHLEQLEMALAALKAYRPGMTRAKRRELENIRRNVAEAQAFLGMGGVA